jgi:SAM-dependent methyltransferase
VDSRDFIELGRIYTPARDEIRETILDLMPAEQDEPFLAVELGVGAGWLSAAILERFPAARVIGLDGSPAMLRETGARLQPFAGRFELRRFRLEHRPWLGGIGTDVRCFVSSLVIHHLDAAGKQMLYRDLHAHLAPGGAALIADLMAPRGERERRYMARRWEAEVQRQSLAFSGSLDAYLRFVEQRLNWYDYPDPMDMPSTVPEHLQWLADAGFGGVNIFWERAGHAIYGGYKAP